MSRRKKIVVAVIAATVLGIATVGCAEAPSEESADAAKPKKSNSAGASGSRVSGTERDLFEHSFVVRVRGALGGVAAQRIMTATGPWSTTLSVGGPRRPGTVEAVAGSAKDGSLDCLVQVPVTLGA